MPPVYLTPKSSAASPDSMAVCPIPPQRNNDVKSCQVFVGSMNVPKLKLSDCGDDDFKLGFFLAAPSELPGFGDDEALSSFVPIERGHRCRSVPTIKLRPRPSLAFAGAHALNTSIGISPIPTDNDEEERVTLTSSTPFVTRVEAKKSPAAIKPVSKKTPSLKMKNSYKLAALNSKRLKVRSPVTSSARAGTRLPSSTSRAA